MSKFINQHNIIFGIIFILISGHFSLKSEKTLTNEYLDKKWMDYSFTISIFLFWFVMLVGGILILIGYSKF